MTTANTRYAMVPVTIVDGMPLMVCCCCCWWWWWFVTRQSMQKEILQTAVVWFFDFIDGQVVDSNTVRVVKQQRKDKDTIETPR
jgi:hypothetical protein